MAGHQNPAQRTNVATPKASMIGGVKVAVGVMTMDIVQPPSHRQRRFLILIDVGFLAA
jgi:hypothetical protein